MSAAPTPKNFPANSARPAPTSPSPASPASESSPASPRTAKPACLSERDRSRASVTRRASRGLRVKYISDTFEEHRTKLLAGQGDYAGANAADPDEPSGANRVERLDPPRKRPRPDQSDGETYPEQTRLPAGLAGRGGADGARASGVAVCGVGVPGHRRPLLAHLPTTLLSSATSALRAHESRERAGRRGRAGGETGYRTAPVKQPGTCRHEHRGNGVGTWFSAGDTPWRRFLRRSPDCIS